VVEDAAGEEPMGYSRQNIIFGEWGGPSWLTSYRWELARYPWQFGTTSQYRSLEVFFEERAWTYPKDLAESFKPYTPFWQVSERIDARATFANARTDDPEWPVGLYNGTASVSTAMTARETITWLGGEPAGGDELEERVRVLEVQVAKLETMAHIHPEDDVIDPPPDLPPDRETVRLSVLKDENDEHQNAPAFAPVGENAVGKYIVGRNVYQETGDPALVRRSEDEAAWTVYVDRPDVDSEDLWYEIAEDVNHHGYPMLFVKASKLA